MVDDIVSNAVVVVDIELPEVAFVDRVAMCIEVPGVACVCRIVMGTVVPEVAFDDKIVVANCIVVVHIAGGSLAFLTLDDLAGGSNIDPFDRQTDGGHDLKSPFLYILGVVVCYIGVHHPFPQMKIEMSVDHGVGEVVPRRVPRFLQESCVVDSPLIDLAFAVLAFLAVGRGDHKVGLFLVLCFLHSQLEFWVR